MSDDDNSISLPLAGDGEVANEDDAQNDDSGGILEDIDREVEQNEVVLYMKGDPQQPMCGFSARAAGLLEAYGVSFHAVDVLTEEPKR
ncbi:MAG: glutaredoxin domain-containing protein, partial [Bradymonadaceae bacterium]